MRDIADVLHFRGDLSPFLVHLTKSTPRQTWNPLAKKPLRTAAQNLESILREGRLRQSGNKLSIAAFGASRQALAARVEAEPDFIARYLAAVSFTETPLGEIHSLLEIDKRQVQLEPYGLVFLRSRLMRKGVEPAIYLNNYEGDKDLLVQLLFLLVDTAPDVAERILPLLTVFGRYITAPGAQQQTGELDFLWEREWRYRGAKGDFAFDRTQDVFMGLCPHEEIAAFESRFDGLPFIDPSRNMKWYAKKLIKARQELDLKDSVV